MIRGSGQRQRTLSCVMERLNAALQRPSEFPGDHRLLSHAEALVLWTGRTAFTTLGSSAESAHTRGHIYFQWIKLFSGPKLKSASIIRTKYSLHETQLLRAQTTAEAIREPQTSEKAKIRAIYTGIYKIPLN